jgi:arylsulfatase A-like enzyme
MLLRLSSLLLAASLAAAEPPPNLLLIFTDDHGWADLGIQGVDPDIRTPQTDQLARDGVRFTRGYVTGPQCVPSRAGVISGRHQNRFGVDDNNRGPLPLEVFTLPERLQRHGYATGMSGKWHLDLSRDAKSGGQKVDPRFLPQAHGFDEYWCGSLRQYHASHALDGTAFPDAPRLVQDTRFRITSQTEAALAFLDRRARQPDQPWFLYLPWFAPHVPLESPEPWFSQTPAHLPKERRQALAMIAAMDDGLGRLRAKLREMGQEQRTLIFYIADNGAPLKTGAWDGSLNRPLIGEKGMLTDGGVRVPFVAAWPGTLPAGQIFEQPVSSLDVAATILARQTDADKAGTLKDLDGVDLLPHATGKKSGPVHEHLFWRWRSQAAVLEFPWKLIRLGDTERYLFNVTHPEGETQNRLAEQPELVARLEQKLKAWSATLHRPGPAEPLNEQDRGFFADHVDPSLQSAARPGRKQAPAADWLARNGQLELRDGLLVLQPEAGAKNAFLTRSQFRVRGPVTARLSLKTNTAGKAALAWRSASDKDFLPAKRVSFDLVAGDAWQVVEVSLPEEDNLIHLRLHAPPGGLQLRSLLLHPAKAPPLSLWNTAP